MSRSERVFLFIQGLKIAYANSQNMSQPLGAEVMRLSLGGMLAAKWPIGLKAYWLSCLKA
jgi:hypothetical protein